MDYAHQRAAYVSSIVEFHATQTQAVLGHLAQSQMGDLTPTQKDAWLGQIEVLKHCLPKDLIGTICFEYAIPRIGKRVDNVLLIGEEVIVIEFKVGAATYEQDAKRQVLDYALDLKNFHLGSRDAVLTPVLVATEAPHFANELTVPFGDVFPVVLANKHSLAMTVKEVSQRSLSTTHQHARWLASGYKPTPTIVEASQALYRGHRVEEITHSEAGASNLTETTKAIASAIDDAKARGRKVICFVSGIPGAGKTLAGLNLVCQRRRSDLEDEEHAVFLSGNGPLVSVLQEALVRDEVRQASDRDIKILKGDAKRRAVAFIQNIHHFRDEYLDEDRIPPERVVVFDEAQRAWDSAQTSKFMRQKRGHPDFSASEPQFLIGVMDRHPDWTAVVCLIGGGQEINTGEAGVEEWLCAIRDHFPLWDVRLPAHLDEGALLRFKTAELGSRVKRDSALHLGVSLRSFRSELLSTAVGTLMGGSAADAKQAFFQVLPKFPILITRSIASAKQWLKQKARGSERYGLLASSGAKRLKPLGISMDAQIDPCTWFLNDETDVRSSFYLEDAGSEFDVQGLELDWTAVLWDGDLIHRDGGWRCRAFKGTKWQEIRDSSAQRFRINAYRVLLTRARQGMIIVVPEGDGADHTRSPDFYNPTWAYLQAAGLPILQETAQRATKVGA